MSHFISGDILIDWPMTCSRFWNFMNKHTNNMWEEQIGQNKGKDSFLNKAIDKL